MIAAVPVIPASRRIAGTQETRANNARALRATLFTWLTFCRRHAAPQRNDGERSSGGLPQGGGAGTRAISPPATRPDSKGVPQSEAGP